MGLTSGVAQRGGDPRPQRVERLSPVDPHPVGKGAPQRMRVGELLRHLPLGEDDAFSRSPGVGSPTSVSSSAERRAAPPPSPRPVAMLGVIFITPGLARLHCRPGAAAPACGAAATPLYAPLPSSDRQASQVATTPFMSRGSLLRSSTPPRPNRHITRVAGRLPIGTNDCGAASGTTLCPNTGPRRLGRATVTAEG